MHRCSSIRNDVPDFLRTKCVTKIQSRRCSRSTGLIIMFSRFCGIFRRVSFRARSTEEWNEGILEDPTEIAEAVARGLLVPSLDVFLWSLAVARIKHYGNDFDFFTRLAEAVGDDSLKDLQCTGDEEDCKRFLKFDDDYGMLLDIDGSNVQLSKRKNQPVKLTRVTSFNSVLVALGDEAKNTLQDYASGKYGKAHLSFNSKGCSCNIIDESPI